MMLLLPNDPALRLGVLLVLLVPCTDWFITFTHVVLPFALTLPIGWETTVVVIVLQSLVELFAMVFYLWWIPRSLFRA